ncbi:MAG: F0F1 ATP synthase subunit B', partial [Stellaceae bacterium]
MQNAGMPQLDLHTFPSLLFWLAVTFIVLYVIMAWAGLPLVGGILERRKTRISDDLAKAAQLKAEAETVIQAYERALAEAHASAQATVRETLARLGEAAAARQRELAQSLAAETEAAERRIRAAREAA